jgi:hypothetical protein
MAEIGGTPVAIYALLKRVELPEDPDALPDEDTFEANMIDTTTKHLARMLARP